MLRMAVGPVFVMRVGRGGAVVVLVFGWVGGEPGFGVRGRIRGDGGRGDGEDEPIVTDELLLSILNNIIVVL